MYQHDEHTIDPRDKDLITWNPNSRKFITEASTLQANGIKPTVHNYTIGGTKQVIWLWSPKFELSIPYRQQRVIRAEGDVIATVYTPYFAMISTLNETRANIASANTELHIIND